MVVKIWAFWLVPTKITPAIDLCWISNSLIFRKTWWNWDRDLLPIVFS